MNRYLTSTLVVALMLCGCTTTSQPTKPPRLITQPSSHNAPSPLRILKGSPYAMVFRALQHATLDTETLGLLSQLSIDLAKRGDLKQARAVAAYTSREIADRPASDALHQLHDQQKDAWRWPQRWMPDTSHIWSPQTSMSHALVSGRRPDRVRLLLNAYQRQPSPQLEALIVTDIENEPRKTRKLALWLQALERIQPAPVAWLKHAQNSAITSKDSAQHLRVWTLLCTHNASHKRYKAALMPCRKAFAQDPSFQNRTRIVLLEARVKDVKHAIGVLIEQDWSPSIHDDFSAQHRILVKGLANIAMEQQNLTQTLMIASVLGKEPQDQKIRISLARHPSLDTKTRDKLLASASHATNFWTDMDHLSVEMSRLHTNIILGKERRASLAWHKLEQRAHTLAKISAQRKVLCEAALLQHQHPTTRSRASKTLRGLLTSLPTVLATIEPSSTLTKPSYNLQDLLDVANALILRPEKPILLDVFFTSVTHPHDQKLLTEHVLKHMHRHPSHIQQEILSAFALARSRDVHATQNTASTLLALMRHPATTPQTFDVLRPALLNMHPRHLKGLDATWVQRAMEFGRSDVAIAMLQHLGPMAREIRFQHILLQHMHLMPRKEQRALTNKLLAWAMGTPNEVSSRTRILLATRLSEQGDCPTAKTLLSTLQLRRKTKAVVHALPSLVRTCAATHPTEALSMAGMHSRPQTRASLYLWLFRQHPAMFAQWKDVEHGLPEK